MIMRANWMIIIIQVVLLRSLLSLSKEVRIMTYNIRTASEWANYHGGDYPTRTWERRIKSVANTIMIAKPDVGKKSLSFSLSLLFHI